MICPYSKSTNIDRDCELSLPSQSPCAYHASLVMLLSQERKLTGASLFWTKWYIGCDMCREPGKELGGAGACLVGGSQSAIYTAARSLCLRLAGMTCSPTTLKHNHGGHFACMLHA